jgi:hypothetical protein
MATKKAETKTPKAGSKEAIAYAKEQFGWYADLYESIPELQAIIDRAVRLKYTAQRFTDEVTNTTWWKTTEAKVRAFQEEGKRDPGTQRTNINAKRIEIENYVGKLGYQLPLEAIDRLSVDAYKYGWDTNEIARYVGAEVVKKGTTGMGGTTLSGLDAQSVRTWASDYGVPLTEDLVQQYTNGLIARQFTEEQIKQNLRQDAEILYPALRAQLAAGRTVTQIVSPFKSIAANKLGVAPDAIDFSDPNKFGRLLTYQDPNSGEVRMMNASEWERYIRTLPEWQNTDEARNLYRDVASTLTRGFGKVIG